MDQTLEKKGAANGKDEKSNSITDYLTAPRKKRKNYVVLALGRGFDQDLQFAVDTYVKRNFPNLAVSAPETSADLSRQFGRNISLIVISDEFDDLEIVMELIRTLKRKRSSEVIPILFLTRDPRRLVDAYHRFLLPYHEGDEYINYPGINRHKIFSRIKNGIENKNRRRSRRYTVDLPVTYYHLEKNAMFPGRILDLSVHGALLHAESECIFRDGDQLKIHFPIAGYLPIDQGEFLKLSAKVRRVFISGNMTGISFEYISPSQLNNLTRLVTELMSRDLERKAHKLKTHLAQQRMGR